jgi:hypothetical protein
MLLDMTPGAAVAATPLSVTVAGVLVGMVTVAVVFTGTVSDRLSPVADC